MIEVFDIEQSLLLLELEAPFVARDVQLARRSLAKRWHPDIAPPGRELEHEHHLKAINEAADRLQALAEASRSGRVTQSAVRANAAAARKARADAGTRAYQESQQKQSKKDQKNDPFADRAPDHSVVHRYARCSSYPEWGVGSVTGIYFTTVGEDLRQWARVKFAVGVRTVPAGSLQFVDFSKPDPAADRAERFMVAAKHALAEGSWELAAQRLVYARNADPNNRVIFRLMAFAFWRSGNSNAAQRAARDWARSEPKSPAPHRFSSRLYEDLNAIELAVESAGRAVKYAPNDASDWARLGRLYLRTTNLTAAVESLEHSRNLEPSAETLLDLALAHQLSGNTSAEVVSCEQATILAPNWDQAWTQFAYALARTDRTSEALTACKQAIKLGAKADIEELIAQLKERQPSGLHASSVKPEQTVLFSD